MNKLAQIAAEANVSPNTVLRVLRGESKEVWPSALERATQIRNIARRLGYMPNSSARAMRNGCFNTIALVLSTDSGRSYLPDELFCGIHDALSKLGMRLIVCRLGDNELTNSHKVPAILREWSCDGLLVNYTDRVPDQMMSVMSQNSIPFVWINRKQPCDAVYYDDLAGAAVATRHLLSLGHRKITYIDFCPREEWPETHYSHQDRYEGYALAMREAGLEPTARTRFAGISVRDRLKALIELCKCAERPTAFLGYDCGIRLVHAAAFAGLEVPRDLSVLTFGSAYAAAPEESNQNYIGCTLGTISVPAQMAGIRAVNMLMRKIKAKQEPLAAEVLPLELFPGETCGPCPTTDA